MAKREKLVGHVVALHRNGISGAGFYMIHFIGGAEDVRGRHFIATVFEARGHVAEINPLDVTDCWRGDNFETELRAIIAAHEAEEDKRWRAECDARAETT